MYGLTPLRNRSFRFAILQVAGLLTGACVFLLTPAPAHGGQFDGQWRGATLWSAGMLPSKPGCRYLGFTAVRIQLEETTRNNYEGYYLQEQHEYPWVSPSNKHKCVRTNTNTPGALINIKNWRLSGRVDPASNRLRISGHSGGCLKTSDWCDKTIGNFKGPAGDFKTEFSLQSNRLIDTFGNNNPADDLLFITLQAETRALTAALKLSMSHYQHLKDEAVEEFIEDYNPAMRVQVRSHISEMKRVGKAIRERRLHWGANVSKYILVWRGFEGAVLINRQQGAGRASNFIHTLEKKDGIWYINGESYN